MADLQLEETAQLRQAMQQIKAENQEALILDNLLSPR
jgi:hypothetical protein